MTTEKKNTPIGLNIFFGFMNDVVSEIKVVWSTKNILFRFGDQHIALCGNQKLFDAIKPNRTK